MGCGNGLGMIWKALTGYGPPPTSAHYFQRQQLREHLKSKVSNSCWSLLVSSTIGAIHQLMLFCFSHALNVSFQIIPLGGRPLGLFCLSVFLFVKHDEENPRCTCRCCKNGLIRCTALPVFCFVHIQDLIFIEYEGVNTNISNSCDYGSCFFLDKMLF